MEINLKHRSDNFWPGNNPISLMLHTTGGDSLIGAIETLIIRGLSYNYIIFKGEIYELVHWRDSAWHAGVIKRPNLRSQAFYKTLKGEDNPNRHSIGIAFVETSPLLSEEDVNAFVWLSKQLGVETGNRWNADNIFYHREVTADKPWYVKNFRDQCLEALVGDKDEKDAGEKSQREILIAIIKIYLEIFKRKNEKSN
jgi:N-acetyl-anhydromuramyl-L-alanine amidase AmpD